ncbi:CAP domain-containing protein [Blastococcus sp. TF02A_35]|uniref:CAP domain-containing protein n=1 Tax=Blastococcus sp. TF02A-35 TaxID=2559612 RepID=UPI001FD78456|nr:CAP domain-containing protein [Blastococcus sp. TF02A_35]
MHQPSAGRRFGTGLALALAAAGFWLTAPTSTPAEEASGTAPESSTSVFALTPEPLVAGAPTAAPVPEAPAAVPPPPAEAPAPVEEPAPEPTAPTTAAAPVAQAPRVAAAAPAPAPSGSSREAAVIALVNQQRAAAGCGPLVADAGLAAVAAAHSADMRDRGYFDHVDPSGQDPFDRARSAGQAARAENIAMGQRDAAAVMDAWMNSAGHRANILDCDLSRLGVGVADGGNGPWWTQLFG